MAEMQKVKEHFEEEASEFDETIRRLIPHYGEMVAAVVHSLPFAGEDAPEVIDLGCGTGTVARAVLDAFPRARLTCVDLALNMLQQAKRKLQDSPEARFLHSDFYDFVFEKPYDAAVSSLALHHLETDGDKLMFYKKIYQGLKAGGVLVNADSVLASHTLLQERYMEQWKAFMYRRLSRQEVEEKWLPKHREEDRPASLADHIAMLREAGFRSWDVIWKYYGFAVYWAQK